MREVVRGNKHNLRKFANCSAQISVHSEDCTGLCFAICKFFQVNCVCHLEQLHAQSPSLVPIVFGINLMPFSILAQYSLSFVLVCASLLEPLHGRNCRCLWLWQLGFGVSLRVATSNLSLFPQHPSQTEVCSMMGESIRPSSLYNPTLPANKHVVQICRYSLSAAADGLADVSRERRTSPFNGDAQSWNDTERSLSRAVVPQSLPVSATTFPTVLSLYIAQGHLRKNIRYPSCS